MDNNTFLENKISEVESVSGSGTAMVSLYISKGSNISSEKQRMSQEKSEASNIKDKNNRKNVKKAIDRVNDILKRYEETPKNGIVIFVGVTREDTFEFVFDDLDQPLEYSDYTCDSKFYTDPLKEIISPDHNIGLVVVERGGCAIGELRGTNITVHYDEESNVMGKHNAGGQCVSPKTKIIESDGTVSRIDKINTGDNILGMDLSKDKITRCVVKNKWKTTKTEYNIKTNNSMINIRASEDHTVFTINDDFVEEKRVSNLEAGDMLLYLNDKYNKSTIEYLCYNTKDVISSCDSLIKRVPVRSVSLEEEETELVDIETTSGNFFANGLLVHNSAERFDRLIEEQKDNYFDSVKDKLTELFIDNDNQPTVDGIVIGGTQVTVDNFISDGYLPKTLKDVMIGGIYSVDIANEESLERLANKSRDEIEHISKQEEREIVEEFLGRLHENSSKYATYGEEMVNKSLEYGAVDKILISENRDRNTIKEYKKKVENQGGSIKIISDDFSEGNQFWQGFNGLGALLRYQIE